MALLVACGSAGEPDLFEGKLSTNQTTCNTAGTWATFVEIGVGWESGTIKPGAGTVRQWILTRRQVINGTSRDVAQACGIGAKGVTLGSAWFSTREFPQLDPPLESEWTGVRFRKELFDSGELPVIELPIHVYSATPDRAQVGDPFDTVAVPFQFGVEGLAPDGPWPPIAEITPVMVDHDLDGDPGLSGLPYEGQVPGEPEGTTFMYPRLGIEGNPDRASALFMAIRTRAALNGTLVSCDPPRLEGQVVPGSLLVETRNIGCRVAGTGALCDSTQLSFIDSNLPAFQPNGTSKTISIKVPDNTSCADVRNLDFGIDDTVP